MRVLLAVAVLMAAVGCGDDTADVGAGTPVELPARAADLVGTVTAVTSLEPRTADVLGTVVVEEVPHDASAGRKIAYTVTTDTVFDGVDGFDDMAEGQAVDTWVAGDLCAESYPEQCSLEAVRVTA